MKKITLIVLAVILCVSAVAVPVFAATPRYANVYEYDVTLSISSTGLAKISIEYIGYADATTSATVTTKLQKKTLGLFWTTVDIGEYI